MALIFWGFPKQGRGGELWGSLYSKMSGNTKNLNHINKKYHPGIVFHVFICMYQRDFRGDPNSSKIGFRRDLKLHTFDAEGAENFEKMKVFKGKIALFGVL